MELILPIRVSLMTTKKVVLTGLHWSQNMVFRIIVEMMEIKVQLTYSSQSGHMDGHMETLFQNKTTHMKPHITI
jgi:hypothetical protein